jgi:glycine/D-amino acid oxidase-like deaminating enzyme
MERTEKQMTRRIVVIGGGVVGSAVAAELTRDDRVSVTVVERGPGDRLVGSTRHAPGVVGLLSEAPVLTGLARLSAQVYQGLAQRGTLGFDRVGGLEVATSPAAARELERRAALAADAGLPARLLEPAQAARLAPDLVDPASCRAGLLFPADGTARARVITAALREQARRAGARFVYDRAVTGIGTANGAVSSVRTDEAVLAADDVVLACGIWGPALAALAGVALPLTPVAHPYVHGPARAPAASRSPFVRWPEHHVYACDHRDRLGLGTYDHLPVPVAVDGVESAEQPWSEPSEGTVQRALALLPPASRFKVDTRLNGVYAMTADNLPLLGPVDGVAGLWAAEALWVTHAAGAAQALTQAMMDRTGGFVAEGLEALHPNRFAGQAGQAEQRLTARALRLYNEIDATS